MLLQNGQEHELTGKSNIGGQMYMETNTSQHYIDVLYFEFQIGLQIILVLT